MNNEWVDEGYIRELFDEFKEKYKENVLRMIASFEEIIGLDDKWGPNELSVAINSERKLLTVYKCLLDLDGQLKYSGVDGTILIGNMKGIFSAPRAFTTKKIEGRLMFQELK